MSHTFQGPLFIRGSELVGRFDGLNGLTHFKAESFVNVPQCQVTAKYSFDNVGDLRGDFTGSVGPQELHIRFTHSNATIFGRLDHPGLPNKIESSGRAL